MSDFECINGHLVPASSLRCPKCGSLIDKMDGMKKKELEIYEVRTCRKDQQSVSRLTRKKK